MDAIKKRKSVKKFSDKKPNWRDIVECIDSARYSPMAGNNFSLRFILISDPKKIQKIADASQQPFISQAQYVVAVYSDPSITINKFEKRGEIYLRQQAGAGIQNFLLMIQKKGLSTCWVGHFVDSIIKKELGISAGVNLEAVFPIGYELGKTSKRRKIELDRILYFDKSGNKRMKSLKVDKSV